MELRQEQVAVPHVLVAMEQQHRGFANQHAQDAVTSPACICSALAANIVRIDSGSLNSTTSKGASRSLNAEP
jgi:hypothetical protein